ncbi:hypothetical protein BDW69DRAFT_201007 [Aspergillus filifer]
MAVTQLRISVTIVLSNADAPFAPFQEGLGTLVASPSEFIPQRIDHMQNVVGKPDNLSRPMSAKMKKKERRQMMRERAAAQFSLQVPLPEPAHEPEPEPGHAFNEPAVEPDWPPYDDDADYGTFRIQVSAKHLMLSSPVFEKILTEGFKESITYWQKGSVEIIAESWDILALGILLRAVHGQHSHVPRKLPLEMLTKVAVIAGYYECKEPISIYADIWINSLVGKIPATYSRDLILWLWVAWFFQLPEEFEKSTLIAMSHCHNAIASLGLPIPNNVMDLLNDRRQSLIDTLISKLHEAREAFFSRKKGCGFECSSIMLGALSMHLESNGLLAPRPTAPFLNQSYNDLAQKIIAFQSPNWTSLRLYNYGLHYCPASSFGVLFDVQNDKPKGLDLHALIPPQAGN